MIKSIVDWMKHRRWASGYLRRTRNRSSAAESAMRPYLESRELVEFNPLDVAIVEAISNGVDPYCCHPMDDCPIYLDEMARAIPKMRKL